MYRYFRGHQTFFSQFLELELLDYIVDMDFPGGASGKGSACQCKRHKRLELKKKKRFEFNPWVRKIPWRRAWQPPLA